MNTRDPIFEALDRLAGVADSNPVHDPMPGVTRKVRTHRLRVAAAAGGGSAIAVAAGLVIASVMSFPDPASGPGYADSPSSSPTSEPGTPTAPPSEPALGEWDRARADVDGDGRADTISVMLPEADANRSQDSSWDSRDIRLHVQLSSGLTEELRLGEGLVPTIDGTPDLDGNRTAEVVLLSSGGDAGWLNVYTWDGTSLVPAVPAATSPAALVIDGALYTEAEVVSSSLVDDTLISWVGTDDTSNPFEVRVWTWRLEDDRLVATEEDQAQCMSPGQHPRPC